MVTISLTPSKAVNLPSKNNDRQSGIFPIIALGKFRGSERKLKFCLDSISNEPNPEKILVLKFPRIFIMQNFTKVLAIVLLSCHGCTFVPILVPTPSEKASSPAPQPSEIDEKYKKTCYADALTGSEGRKITESSDNLEIVADKLAASGKHREAIQKYNESSAAALNEAVADGTTSEMEIDTFLFGKEDFEAKYRPLIQRSVELNFKIGSSYARINKLELAIDCFDQTLKIGILPPNDAIAYLNRGDAYERMGIKDKAKTDFQQAATLFKKYQQPTYQKMSEQRLQAVK